MRSVVSRLVFTAVFGLIVLIGSPARGGQIWLTNSPPEKAQSLKTASSYANTNFTELYSKLATNSAAGKVDITNGVAINLGATVVANGANTLVQLTNRLALFYSPEDFGASTNLADNITYLQLAEDTMWKFGRRILLFGAGEYKISQPLKLHNDAKLWGMTGPMTGAVNGFTNQSTIKLTGASTNSVIVPADTTANSWGWEIKGLNIQGSGNSTPVLSMFRVGEAWISRNYISGGILGLDLNAAGTGQCYFNHVLQNNIAYNSSVNVKLQNGANCNTFDQNFNGGAPTGMVLTANASVNEIKDKFQGVGGANPTDTAVLNDSAANSFSGSYIEQTRVGITNTANGSMPSALGISWGGGVTERIYDNPIRSGGFKSYFVPIPGDVGWEGGLNTLLLTNYPNALNNTFWLSLNPQSRTNLNQLLVNMPGTGTNIFGGYSDGTNFVWKIDWSGQFAMNVFGAKIGLYDTFLRHKNTDQLQIANASNADRDLYLRDLYPSGFAASKVVRTDSGGKLAAVTIGAGLTFDGTTLAASGGGGGGEANTASNLGIGYPTFSDKSGVDLRFNTFTNDATLTVSSNANTFTFKRAAISGDVVIAAGANTATIQADSVALGTDTTGNYVANAATSALTGLTGGSAGSEGASLSLGFDYSTALSGNVALGAHAGIFGVDGMIFEGATADNFETFIAITDPTADRTITVPDRSGTVSLSGDTFTGDVAGTLNSSGATALTIQPDSVALGTDTTGNYVASSSNGAGIAGASASAEGGTIAPAWDPVSWVNNITMWDASQATRTWTANLSGATDPVITFGNNSVDVTTGILKAAGNGVITTVNIDDSAWTSSWNGKTTNAPSINAVYDWGHTFDTDDDGKVNVLDGASGFPLMDSGGVISSVAATGSGNVMRTRVGVYRDFFIGAGAMVASTTNGAATGSYAPTGADNATRDVYDFDDTTAESVQFDWILPDEWDLGTIKAKFVWTTASGTGGVTWGIAAAAVGDNGSSGAVLGTEVTVNDTRQADNVDHITAATGAVTVGNTPALGKTVHFKVRRIPTDGSDTKTGDARLLGVEIQYNETTTEQSLW